MGTETTDLTVEPAPYKGVALTENGRRRALEMLRHRGAVTVRTNAGDAAISRELARSSDTEVAAPRRRR